MLSRYEANAYMGFSKLLKGFLPFQYQEEARGSLIRMYIRMC